MDRNLPVLFVRRFVPLVVRGIGFTVIMMVTTIFAVARGIWEQSDLVARAWMRQVAMLRGDSRFDDPMYWIIRFTTVTLMVVCLLVISRLIGWILNW